MQWALHRSLVIKCFELNMINLTLCTWGSKETNRPPTPTKTMKETVACVHEEPGVSSFWGKMLRAMEFLGFPGAGVSVRAFLGLNWQEGKWSLRNVDSLIDLKLSLNSIGH